MRYRALIVATLILATLTSFAAPNHRASAGPTVTPTCRDLKPFIDYEATQFLTAPGTLIGTNGPDVLVGSPGADIIKGLGGDDIICGGGGVDVIDGGPGNDHINAYYASAGYKHISGEAGNDVIYAQDSDVYGGSGNDELVVSNGREVLGGAGDDNFRIFGAIVADGGSGNDYVLGFYSYTTLKGGSGDDTLWNADSPSVGSLDGGSGTDKCRARQAPTRRCEIALT